MSLQIQGDWGTYPLGAISIAGFSRIPNSEGEFESSGFTRMPAVSVAPKRLRPGIGSVNDLLPLTEDAFGDGGLDRVTVPRNDLRLPLSAANVGIGI